MLGIEHWELRRSIHSLEEKSQLGGADLIMIYDDGSVTDTAGEHLGNLLDEI